MALYCAVDMGGTKIIGSIFDDDGTALRTEEALTYPTPDAEPLTTLIAFLRTLISDDRVDAIGIGIPGIVNPQTRLVDLAVALNWSQFDLEAQVKAELGVDVRSENDVNLMAIGEHRFGAGQGVDNLVTIGVGTGIGAGLILNGDLYHGHLAIAGEVGYMLPDRAFLDNRYEGFGALETVAGGAGIAEVAKTRYGHDLTTPQIFQQARDGQAWAIELVETVADYLAIMIANTTVLLAPERIILTGSVMKSSDLLIGRIQTRLNGRIPYIPPLVLSQLGAHATIYGALSLVLPR